MNTDVFKHYTTGIIEVDDQHFKMLEMVEKISLLIKSRNTEATSLLICGFTKLSNDHFRDEEHMMRTIEFPYLRAHCEDHKNLLNKIKPLINTADGTVFFGFDVFFRDFVNHIDNYDLQYVPFYKKWSISQQK